MTDRTGFAHLQVHSHFTLMGGTASVGQLAERAASEGMTSLALTDTNGLYGAVAFVRACRAVDIKPILGVTVTVAAPDMHVGSRAFADQLVLLATGPAGYRSLCRISSHIQSDPQRELRMRRGLGWDQLQEHSEGLICLSGGRRGLLERCLRAGDRAGAVRFASQLADTYGERAFLSVEVHQASDLQVVRDVVDLGQQVGVRQVAAQPVYCLSVEDRSRLRLLAAIGCNSPADAVPASALPADGDPSATLHWLSAGEVAERFAEFPEALTTVAEIIERCGPALPEGRPLWPPVDLPEGQTPEGALELLANAGLEERFGPASTPAARERLGSELVAIAGHGSAPLFLVVADIARFARQADIPMNTRGSVANSLVAYCIGITSVNPLAHDLLFERFLNPARADLPDIDLDFCSRRRDRVLEYVRRTYGSDHVALVSTMTTLRLRSAVRETAKALGLDEVETRRLVSSLPRGWHPDPRRRDTRTIDDVLADLDEVRLRRPSLDNPATLACTRAVLSSPLAR
jgi:DNA polymerase-3 subunit alpha